MGTFTKPRHLFAYQRLDKAKINKYAKFDQGTVSHFSYAPLFQGPHFLTKMLELQIRYDNLIIGILSV